MLNKLKVFQPNFPSNFQTNSTKIGPSAMQTNPSTKSQTFMKSVQYCMRYPGDERPGDRQIDRQTEEQTEKQANKHM